MRFPLKQLMLLPLIIGLSACEHTASSLVEKYNRQKYGNLI